MEIEDNTEEASLCTDFDAPAKRHRSGLTSSSESTINTDIYDDVYQGCVNETSRLSWLSSLYSCQYGQGGDETTKSGELVSLDQQLVQLKRKLWPAALACAEASESQSAGAEFGEARRACNPLEVLGEGRDGGLNRMFMNRSAIKLANVDALLGNRLLNHPLEAQDPQKSIPAFLFVDLCGAPGGFSEYVMKESISKPMYSSTGTQITASRGYGMSLHGINEHGKGIEWKLDDMSEVVNGCHTCYHVCTGEDGTGDLYRWENVIKLQSEIKEDLRRCGLPHIDTGVHLVVADGGFDAQRNSEIQEQLSQKLVVCEVAAGLALLRQGGTLLIKMFGFQTSVSQRTMHDLKQLFADILIFKPITSRPASSERYVICRGFRGIGPDWDGRKWRDHIFASGFHEQKAADVMLNRFDRDLLNLNLKACFSILSYLDHKAKSANLPHDQRMQLVPERPPINIGLYAQALGL